MALLRRNTGRKRTPREQNSGPRSGPAWFVDGEYLSKTWAGLGRPDVLDYTALRQLLELHYCRQGSDERIQEAYYFSAVSDPDTAHKNVFFSVLRSRPPTGPGLDVRLYWLQHRELKWPTQMGNGPVVHPQTGEPYVLTMQKAVDVGLIFHLMRSHAQHGWRKLFLGAGDGDFHEPVRHLVMDAAVELVLIGARNTISSELLPFARHEIYLEDIAHSVARARPPRDTTSN